MAEEIEYVYFKSTVRFGVGIRFFQRDPNGMVLNPDNPYVNIEKAKLREFLQANKEAIGKGLIKQVDEPSFDFVNDNTLSDEEITELVKNLFILRKKLPLVTSESTLARIYEEAKFQNRSKKIMDLIEERYAEVSPLAMQGVGWGTEKDMLDKEGGA